MPGCIRRSPAALCARRAWNPSQPAAEPRTPRCHRHACSAAASTDYALSQIPNYKPHPALRLCAGDQVTNGKPAPDIFLRAAHAWQPAPAPAACLVFEDAPSGLAAAKAAGM